MRVCRKVKGSHDASLKGLEEVLPSPRHTFQPCPCHKVGPSTTCSLSHLPSWRAPASLMTCVCYLTSPPFVHGRHVSFSTTASQSRSRGWEGHREANWKTGPGSPLLEPGSSWIHQRGGFCLSQCMFVLI